MTDATWTNLINGVVTVLLAYIAFRQSQLKSQVKDVAAKADERSGKLDEVIIKCDEIHQSIPPNFKP